MVFEDTRVKELLGETRVLWALSHASSLLGWDAETYMPKMGINDRAIAMGELSVLSQKLLLRDEIVKRVEALRDADDLNIYEKAVVRVLDKQIRIMKSLPPEFVKEFAETKEKARHNWRIAKEKDKFEIFEPYLNKIIELCIRAAEYIGYEEHPYDAMIDLYEDGMVKRDVDRIFDYLEPRIKDLLDKILSGGLVPRTHELEDREYPVDSMRLVNRRILEILGYPFDRGRLDESAHPFTIHMGLDDVRITTRYEGKDFKKTMYSVIHEYGHALYELQIDPALARTPIASGASLGIHESQSRFWENIIGRSMAFIEGIYPILREHLDFIKGYDVEDLYPYFNTVKPSLIRVDADEVTYNLHILLRFRLEVLMVSGEVKARDASHIWIEEMDRLLGVKPRSHREGILQDIHWSMGSIGYFPTYTIGNMVAAQIRHHISRDIPGLWDDVSSLDFKGIREYLREKIHKWGSTFRPVDLLMNSFGEGLEPRYLIEYLYDKYVKSYP